MEQFIADNTWLIVAAGLWALPWTGIALWKAARRGEKGWFIALLLIQTVGLLEILYIFVFSKRKGVETEKPKSV
ncbi:MAG: DUF5652 family protein [Candidatus Paceibacteria bacterium]